MTLAEPANMVVAVPCRRRAIARQEKRLLVAVPRPYAYVHSERHATDMNPLRLSMLDMMMRRSAGGVDSVSEVCS